MSSEKKKFQWKPNLFDLAVVVIGAAVMALILLVLRPAAAGVDRTQTMEFTVEVQNMPEGTWELVHIGDPIYDSSRKVQIGTVASVSSKPYTMSMAKADGSAVVDSVMPGYEVILLDIRTTMTIMSKEVQAEGGYTLRVGNGIYLNGPNYAGSGYIVAIERGED